MKTKNFYNGYDQLAYFENFPLLNDEVLVSKLVQK